MSDLGRNQMVDAKRLDPEGHGVVTTATLLISQQWALTSSKYLSSETKGFEWDIILRRHEIRDQVFLMDLIDYRAREAGQILLLR